jgi:hypothetical protein
MLPDQRSDVGDDQARSEAVDHVVLDDLVADLGDADGQFLAELISSYVQEGNDNAERLAVAAMRPDGPAVAAIAHGWRSTSALIGATTLVSLLREAEAVARNSPGDLPPLAGPITVEHDRVAAWLVRRMESDCSN